MNNFLLGMVFLLLALMIVMPVILGNARATLITLPSVTGVLLVMIALMDIIDTKESGKRLELNQKLTLIFTTTFAIGSVLLAALIFF